MIIDRLITYATRERVVGTDTPVRPRNSDTHKRSIAKALTWRTWGTLDTTIISFLVTGDLVLAGTIGGFELVVGSFGYYFHERLWTLVPWGKP